MANTSNPFDYGGAFTGGFEGGARVGAALGKRFREGQIKRAARKAYDIDSELMDMGILDENGEVIPNNVHDEKTQALLAERDKRLTYLADKAADMDSRGWEGQAQAGLALLRYNPLANPNRAKTGAESMTDTVKGIPKRLGANGLPEEAPTPATPTGESPLPSQVTATIAAPDQFAPERAQMNQLRRVSQITGRQMFKQEEEDALRIRAVNYYGGNILAAMEAQMGEARQRVSTLPKEAQAAAMKEFLPMTPEQQDVLVANLQNAIIYTPALKGAVVEQRDGQVWIDPDGGGAAQGHPVNTLEGMDNLRKMMNTYSQGTMNLLERTRGQEAAAAQAQADLNDKANKFIEDAVLKLPEFFKGGGLSAEAFATGLQRLDGQWKLANPADHSEAFATIATPESGETLVNVRTSEDGRVLYTSRTAADKESTGVPRTIYRDADGNILTGDVLKSYTGADNGNFLLQVASGYNALADANAAAFMDTVMGQASARAQGLVGRGRYVPEAERRAMSDRIPPSVSQIPVAATRKYVTDIITEAGVPPEDYTPREKAEYYINALQKAESGGERDPMKAVGPDNWTGENALGPFQIMPSTATSNEGGLKPINLKTASFEEQKEFAIQYLTNAFKKHGNDPVKALASYNAGPNRKWIADLPAMSYAPDGAQRMSAASTAVPPRPKAVDNVGDSAPDESGKKMQVVGQGKGIFPMAFADGGNVVIPPDLFNFIKAN